MHITITKIPYKDKDDFPNNCISSVKAVFGCAVNIMTSWELFIHVYGTTALKTVSVKYLQYLLIQQG